MRPVGSEVPHPGNGKLANNLLIYSFLNIVIISGLGAGLYEAKDQKHYAYYQWVCFILFFQAILCYVPKWLWSAWEGIY